MRLFKQVKTKEMALELFTRGDGCWAWEGTMFQNGYGKLNYTDDNGIHKADRAHRIVYELLVGEIPAGLHIDHLCRNRACVNPDHMEPVTPRENILRGNSPFVVNARKTHCKRGHEFTPENTMPIKDGNGLRRCRECHRASGRKTARVWRLKHRALV